MTEEEWDALKPGDVVRRIENNRSLGEVHIIWCPLSSTTAYVIETGLVICRPSDWKLVGHMVNKAAPESRTEIIERRLDTEL